MGVQHRYIDRRDWRRITERRSRAETLSDGSFAHRIDIIACSAPAFGESPSERYVIADTGWTWLSWMRPDFPWALTAMRDANGEWIQWYFDIVSGMGADADGRAWFDDMYLDVVALSDGSAFLLDEDEFEAAYASGAFGAEAYARARTAADELLAAFPGGMDALKAFTVSLFDRLA